MKRLTPEEFLKKWYPAGLPISTQQWEDDMPEVMEAFAEHIEASEWVSSKDKLPPKERENCRLSINVLINFGHSAYYDFDTRNWYPMFSEWPIDDVTHWRPLPSPPKSINNG